MMPDTSNTPLGLIKGNTDNEKKGGLLGNKRRGRGVAQVKLKEENESWSQFGKEVGY